MHSCLARHVCAAQAVKVDMSYNLKEQGHRASSYLGKDLAGGIVP